MGGEEPRLFVQADLVSPGGFRFRVKMNAHEIRLYPMQEGDSFKAFMEFYHIVLERIDTDAEPVP